MPRVLNVNQDDLGEDAVFVDRTTKWGNPFRVGEYGRELACDLYEAWFWDQDSLVEALDELKGKNLVCHCAPLRCHADFLLRQANDERSLFQR